MDGFFLPVSGLPVFDMDCSHCLTTVHFLRPGARLMPAEPTDAGIVPYGVRRVDTSSARPSGGHLPLKGKALGRCDAHPRARTVQPSEAVARGLTRNDGVGRSHAASGVG